MHKLKMMTTTEEMKTQPSRDELISAVATIKRAQSNDVIYRSTDTVNEIMKLVKGDEMKFNIHQMIEWLFFMNKEDLFLEFSDYRLEDYRIQKAKKLAQMNSEKENSAEAEEEQVKLKPKGRAAQIMKSGGIVLDMRRRR